ncbi:hypothetical protein Dda_6574 [Drechslerella dactyloides]|uniref:Uncharacterized protein n=1 Tax=Drechslerella dactyloides TaxID=74499 RepID=A0AAD6ITS2_DREDA|nr:hypothetical protein Dda_6574 [Drechslerella dactyloides]
MFGVKPLSKLGIALLGLLILAPIDGIISGVVSKDRGITIDKDGNKWVHMGNGEALPLVDLTVVGEYYPGGPTYNLTGGSLQAIMREVQKSPLWNETAWQNVTSTEDHGTLSKRAKQITYCQREQEGSELGIIPADVQPAIWLLQSPAWNKAYCYADTNKCANIACHKEAAVIVCSHRPQPVRIYCGEVAGKIAQTIVDWMERDRHAGLRAFDFWQPCAGWWIPPKYFTGYSVWDEDPTWDIRVHKWPGARCP